MNPRAMQFLLWRHLHESYFSGGVFFVIAYLSAAFTVSFWADEMVSGVLITFRRSHRGRNSTIERVSRGKISINCAVWSWLLIITRVRVLSAGKSNSTSPLSSDIPYHFISGIITVQYWRGSLSSVDMIRILCA